MREAQVSLSGRGPGRRSALFVTGTGTDVGKTVLAGALCIGLGADYWKPIQCGIPTDSARVAMWIGSERVIPEARILRRPASPNQAAASEGVALRLADFILPAGDGPLVVEGAGGLMVPLNERDYMIDLIAHFGLPVILTARTELGTLNHTLLSIQALRTRCIPLLGVVLNGPEHVANGRDIARHGQTRIIGRMPTLEHIDRPTLAEIYKTFQGHQWGFGAGE